MRPLNRRILMAILALALTARLGWSMRLGRNVDARLPDQAEYLAIASNLLKGEGLKFHDGRFTQDVRAYRMPGFPLFLAGCGADARVARAVQSLLDVSTVLAIFLIARRWLSEAHSLFAAALVAINPFFIYFSALLLSETVFTAMLAWGIVLLLYKRNLLWGGVVLALSVHMRPSAVVLPVALGIAAAMARKGGVSGQSRRAGSGQERVGSQQSAVGIVETAASGQAANLKSEISDSGSFPSDQSHVQRSFWRLEIPPGTSMLCLIILALGPWAYRNHLALGRWIWLTTNNGITLYDGFNPDATGASDQSFLQAPSMRALLFLNELERDQYLRQAAGDWIADTWRKDPRRLVDLTLAKLGRTWTPVPLSQDYGGRPLYRYAAAAYCVPLFVLTLIGLLRGPLPRSAKALLLIPAAYFTIVHAASVGSLRYRLPADAPMAIMAAAALPAVLRRRS